MYRIDRESFLAMVREFFRTGLVDARDRTSADCALISFSTDLIGEGYVTSLTFMELILFLEENLGIDISFSTLIKKRTLTVDSLYAAHLGAAC